MSEEIPDPFTELAALAAQHHEIYEAWIAAGFTDRQALELLKTVIMAKEGGSQ
ncbi:hypothetical protein AB0F46_41290 [Streptomyces sp. NPDC026665]|uniref:hypothetical protein n=1 Tax=Streptomyces sp. NPDC026665 TaxID=3154798 RepID=UPI0033F1183D